MLPDPNNLEKTVCCSNGLVTVEFCKSNNDNQVKRLCLAVSMFYSEHLSLALMHAVIYHFVGAGKFIPVHAASSATFVYVFILLCVLC